MGTLLGGDTAIAARFSLPTYLAAFTFGERGGLAYVDGCRPRYKQSRREQEFHCYSPNINEVGEIGAIGQSWSHGDNMIGEWEIYACANSLIARDGSAAGAKALDRSRTPREAGEVEGHRTFVRIAAAIETLRTTMTKAPTH